jgi:hypothetical protein
MVTTKPKRMSEILKSSSEKDATTSTATATQPYSSGGPTLPIIGAADDALKAFEAEKPSKKRKAQDTNTSTTPKKQSQAPSQATNHSSLYEPWTRLPTELLKLLETQSRLRGAQNIVPVVFSRNQNVKTGINRLKTYLGAYKNPASDIEIPEALKEEDCLIAVSAQGQGATKLVGIVDMVRRVVKPSGEEGEVETWWMYTMLTSVEVESKGRARDDEEAEKTQDSQEDEEAFEPMDVDGGKSQGKEKERDTNTTKKRNVPVLTVWMTRKKIPAFKSAFGEQSFTVQKISNDD